MQAFSLVMSWRCYGSLAMQYERKMDAENAITTMQPEIQPEPRRKSAKKRERAKSIEREGKVDGISLPHAGPAPNPKALAPVPAASSSLLGHSATPSKEPQHLEVGDFICYIPRGANTKRMYTKIIGFNRDKATPLELEDDAIVRETDLVAKLPVADNALGYDKTSPKFSMLCKYAITQSNEAGSSSSSSGQSSVELISSMVKKRKSFDTDSNPVSSPVSAAQATPSKGFRLKRKMSGKDLM
jgi:hypothetical protein